MTLGQLEIFALVAELRGFTLAAQRLGVSQSAVSHALKALDLACSIAGKFGANLKLIQVLEGGEIPQHLIRVVDQAGLAYTQDSRMA